MLDQKLVQKNKQALAEELSRLKGLLDKVATKDEVAGDYHAKYPDFGNKDDENASEVAQYETNIAEEYDLEQRLHKVEKALERITAGTYGKCLVGGEYISVARLTAVPEAENCVEHEN